MRLYRAVSQAERDDIRSLRRQQSVLVALRPNVPGVLRCNQNGYAQGKWFALTEEAGLAWAQRFAGFDGQPYHIIEVEAPEALVAQNVLPNLDNIGPAVFVMADDLPLLAVLTP